MMGPGFIEMSFMMMFASGLFGSGGVMGLPPGERDAKFVQCAPQDSVFYTEWSSRGSGKPGAPGIDGFAADPEIRQFVADVEKAIFTMIDSEVGGAGGPEEVAGKNIPRLIRLLLNRSGCLYLEVDGKAAARLLENPPELPRFTPEFFGYLPAVKATLIVNGAGEADKIAGHLKPLLELIPGGDQGEGIKMKSLPIPLEGAKMVIHRHEDYFILGWGEDAVTRAVSGLKGETEKSLKNSDQFNASYAKVGMERMGMVTWVNISEVLGRVIKDLGPPGVMVAAMAQTLGVDKVEYLASCTGVVEGQIVTKSFLKTGGKTEGLLAVAAGRAVKPSDFSHVPADADLAFALSLSAPKILEAARNIVGTADPDSKEQLDAVIKQLESELGLTLEGDIFPAFGDVWTIYDSPSAGGAFITNAVLGLHVKDGAKAKAVYDKLMEIFKLALPGETRGGRFSRGVYLVKKSFMNHDVHFVNTVGDDDIIFAPAFCLTKSALLIAPHPQAIKSHLRFLDEKGETLEAAVKQAMPEGDMLNFCHVDAKLMARVAAGISPYIAQIVFTEIQRPGTPIDLFSFPSPRAILPYVQTSRSRGWRTEDGLMWETEHALPIPGASAIFAQMPMMFWSMSAVRFGNVQDALEAPAVEIAPE